MNRPGFFNGVLVALVLALVGGAASAGLGTVIAPGTVIQVIVTLLAGAYVLYLLGRSAERSGRVATFAFWCAGALGAWLFAPGLAVLLCAQVVMIWLIRSLYYHGSVLAALADLGLSALALGSAVWAVQQSGSVFMALWCFFLVQALFVVIPGARSREPDVRDAVESDSFDRSYRSAESAIRRIAGRNKFANNKF